MSLLPSCITDDDVESSQSFDGVFHQFLTKSLISNIARKSQTDSTFSLNQRHDFVCVGLFIRVIADRHIGTFTRISNSSGASHTRVASRNECLSSSQATRTTISFFAMIWNRIHFADKAWPRLRLAIEGRGRIFGSGIT